MAAEEEGMDVEEESVTTTKVTTTQLSSGVGGMQKSMVSTTVEEKKDISQEDLEALAALEAEKQKVVEEMNPCKERSVKLEKILKQKTSALEEARRTETLNAKGYATDSKFKIKVIEAKDLVTEDPDGMADCFIKVGF